MSNSQEIEGINIYVCIIISRSTNYFSYFLGAWMINLSLFIYGSKVIEKSFDILTSTTL